MSWLEVSDLAKIHQKQYFGGAKICSKNIEQACLELFGFPKITRVFLDEMLQELQRREQILAEVSQRLNGKKKLDIETAKEFFRQVRGPLFSDNWWDMFLLKRQVNKIFEFVYILHKFLCKKF